MKIHYGNATYTSLKAAFRAINNYEDMSSTMKDLKWHLNKFGEYWLPSGNVVKLVTTKQVIN